MITPIMYVLLSFVPMGILAVVLEAWRHFDVQEQAEIGKDRLLRSPGESSRLLVERLDGKIWEMTLWLFGFPSTLLLCYLSNIRTNPLSRPIETIWLAAFVVAIVLIAVLLWKLINLITERAHRRLAFRGERAVGELLNQLMADGCRVFHDFPLDGHTTINHIVVAPSGIYVIETRARRKTSASRSQHAHEVIYDGDALEFPFHKETQDLAHVRFLVAQLRKYLGDAIEPSTLIKPVLTFPGWYVITRAEGDVIVLNPRKLSSSIFSHIAPVLWTDQIRQIAHLLEQKCRDVEF